VLINAFVEITCYFAAMEFGHVYEGLDTIDFTLPPDTATTLKTLREKKTNSELSVHIGGSRWGEKSWRGIIYPKKVLDKEMINLYSQSFNTVELGATFYKTYTLEETQRWAAQVEKSPEFKFCPRFPQMVSHIRRLLNADQQTAAFYESLKGFGNHLGPAILQLSDGFTPKSFPNLKAYLEKLDPLIKVAVEIRNKNWFADIDSRRQLFDMLSELTIGTVITDSSGRRDCVHMELTTTDAVIRFVGNNLDDTDYKRMDDWVERIAEWKAQGLKSLWFFMHQNDEKHVPEACVYFINKLNDKLKTNIQKPRFIIEIG
jgi:uncharacterized protein YecE (DUF72 family)